MGKKIVLAGTPPLQITYEYVPPDDPQAVEDQVIAWMQAVMLDYRVAINKTGSVPAPEKPSASASKTVVNERLVKKRSGGPRRGPAGKR